MSLKEGSVVKIIDPFTCLIVDDSEFARIHLMEIMMEIIGTGKIRFEMACGGQEAIELYQKFRPDLVMMDIVMPGIDGVETVERICQLDLKARIIMVSSLSYREKVRQAILAGAKNFIVKPIKAELLYRVVVDILTK
ncbi:MAG: two-component system chemotaxis family response regulator CheY [bacterium]|nr:MAG: two-component system chemotaxis family response regulator CheY [bacterium]